MDIKDKEHLLALKVMRLTRPSLYSTLPLVCESVDLPGNLFLQHLLTDLGTPDGFESCSLGNLLMLPQSFGNIFLGETFSCYMSVHNDSTQTVKEVSVKADLQVSSQKIQLTGQNDQQVVPTLAPNCNVDDVIHHEIKEIGTHILVCTVSYVTESGENMHFRKFFKFQVHKPLDVKTKFYNAESDEVYLEAQLQNITSSAICLEKVALEPSSHFTVRQLNTVKCPDGTSKSAFGNLNCLNANDSRQYLFCLTPRPETKVNVKLLKKITSIGKLDIVWRSSMGERGRLQTSQLERMAPGYGDIRLTVEDIPSTVVLDGLFSVKCKVVNCCERAMDLKLTFTNHITEGIVWQGISGRELGKLEPHKSMDIELEAVAVRTGLQSISGIRLTDTFLKRTYDYDELAQVFVFIKGPAS